MALKYEIDSVDELDDAIKPLYTEADGKYRLAVEGVVPESKFSEVNQRAVDAATEAKRRRGTVDKIREALGVDGDTDIHEALKEALTKGKKGDADHDAVLKQVKDSYEGKLKEANSRFEKVLRNGAQAELRAAILDAGFHPEIAGDITATAMNRVHIDEAGEIRIMNAEGKPLAGSGAQGFATFADLAKELAAAKPSFLVDKGQGGGGKPPASGSGNAGQKTVTRKEFDAMSQLDRANFSKSGGKVVDG